MALVSHALHRIMFASVDRYHLAQTNQEDLTVTLLVIMDWEFVSAKSSYEALSKNEFQEANSSILKHPYGNIILAVTACSLSFGGLVFLVWKVDTLFVQESDVLATRFHDTTNWKILWIRETPLKHGQTNDLEVHFVT